MPLHARPPLQANPSTALLIASHTPRALPPAHQQRSPCPCPWARPLTTSITTITATTTTTTSRRNHNNNKKQHRLPASYYRGGTSRAVLFDARDLPRHRDKWAPIFRGVMGSPDAAYGRQLDGMGGGLSSLSKVCVVGPSSIGPAADVDYTFAAVGVRTDEVDYSANCGNMSAAVGPFAVDSGLVKVVPVPVPTPTPPLMGTGMGTEAEAEGEGEGECCMVVVVNIHNTNTGKIIRSTFPVVVDGADDEAEAAAGGDFSIDGVAGTAAPVRLDFLNPGGSRTGKLLPTGNVVDHFFPGPESLAVTCIDVGNPCVFVEAEKILLLRPPPSPQQPQQQQQQSPTDGIPTELTPADIEKDTVLMHRLEKIRRTAGVRMGLAKTEDDVPGSVPKIAMVWKPRRRGQHISPASSAEQQPSSSSSSWIHEDDERGDICVRALSMGQPHKAVPVTVALSLAAAAQLPGTVVHQCLGVRTSGRGEAAPRAEPGDLEISHPTGLLRVNAKYTGKRDLESAAVYRTARRLMQGTIFWK